MFAEIITIGDELLIGQVVDTNSSWISKALNVQGIEVIQITSIRDREKDILQALDEAMHRADIILLTGGLGPTKDDITKQTLCRYFNTELVFSSAVFENVKKVLSNRIPLNQLNRNQALVPKDCTVINNRVGSAPVSWFDKAGKVIISMPGVPEEMKVVMIEEILPRLKERFHTDTILHQTFLVKNHPEAILAEELAGFEDSLPEELSLAYLPKLGLIRLRLTAIGKNKEALQKHLDECNHQLRGILKDDILIEEDAPIQYIVGELLKQKGLTLGTAESCTGGKIATQLTAMPGSSNFYKGSIIAYSNEVKMNLLNVSAHTLAVYGAVSEETVVEMVKGAMRVLNTDCIVATTGIAGPTGGTKEKPVGRVWMAAGYENRIITKLQEGDRGREMNIIRASNGSLLLLHELIK
ncbi:MAG: CinA family nicotinamide mononucleotide deamidase-related protein [Bacteroidales bacterium]|nr:CinA family nicotinamide mononucleotide deamidase-related protein [Bacteroidales bacterium]